MRIERWRRPPGAFPLYRATATEHFVLDDGSDERLAVDLGGSGASPQQPGGASG